MAKEKGNFSSITQQLLNGRSFNSKISKIKVALIYFMNLEIKGITN
jgi:hypothetical protein